MKIFSCFSVLDSEAIGFGDTPAGKWAVRNLHIGLLFWSGDFYDPTAPFLSSQSAILLGMESHTKLTPQFFFLSIGVLATLIASVSSFLSLAFATLDQVLPDALTASYQYGYASYSFESMRSALAILIIVFPVFLILSRLWARLMKKEMSRWDEVVRRWAIYLILFLASVTVIVDLVMLVRYFVSGEITLRFILKVAATLIAASIPGWYYAQLLRPAAARRLVWERWAIWKSVVLVLALIVWSFTVMGSPDSQRDLRLDQRRVEDLQSIQWQVISYWQQKEILPESLSELSNPISSYMVPRDPEFQKGKSYEYAKRSDMTFELCATFAQPMPEGWVEQGRGYGGVMGMRDMDIAVSSMPYPGPGGAGDSWDHEAGRTCYERTIDPELYPPFPKPEKR